MSPLLRALAVLVLVPGLLGGCGWSAGLVLPEGVRTVGVEVFPRDRLVLERGLEPRLADALSQAVSDLVGAPLATPRDADWVLEGEIVEVRRRAGIRSTDNRILETAVRVRIEARLVDRRSGAVTAATTEPYVWGGYALDQPGNEDLSEDRVLRYLAETIVLDLFTATPRSNPDGPAE